MNTAKSMMTTIIRAAGAVLLSMACVAAAAEGDQQSAQNSIENISYSTLQGGRVVLKITTKSPLASTPAGFTVNNPPRIALDFANTANGLGKSAITVGEGALRSVNLVQAGERTRLVMNLAVPVAYDTRIEGKDLLVTLQKTASAASAPVNVTEHFAEAKPAAGKHSLRDVDFRRGKNGEGRVVVDMSDASTGIDIRQQGDKLIVDFMDTALPSNLERRLDVLDFGTPVQALSTFRQGGNVRLMIEPKGTWEYSAYQTDRLFIVEIKPVIEDPNKLVQGGRPGTYSGEKLSLNFQNVEVRSVLQVIADFTGKNIVASDSVSGNLTLRLKDVPWDQALDLILDSKGLDKRVNGNVIRIAPREELAIQEEQKRDLQAKTEESEPLVQEEFKVKYLRAGDVYQMLTGGKSQAAAAPALTTSGTAAAGGSPASLGASAGLLSKRGNASFDERTNLLLVRDISRVLDNIRHLLSKIDVPVVQVMIDARLVEANENFAKNLGARLGTHDQTGQGVSLGNFNGSQYRALFGGPLEDTGYHTGQTVTSPNIFGGQQAAGGDQVQNINMPAGALSGFNPGTLSVVLFRQGVASFLNLELSALQADGKGKVISNPRVMTGNGGRAYIERGYEVPYLQASASGATNVSFKKAVLSLEVIPQVTPDDNVQLKLTVKKDNPDWSHSVLGTPPIIKREVTTEVLVENGGTVVIGGIFEETQSGVVTKVPLFGDIPVLGNLFKNKTDSDEKQELLIFVTPRIVKESLNVH